MIEAQTQKAIITSCITGVDRVVYSGFKANKNF